ncbi:MAG: hypothetical protein EOP55_07865 [Sphingobacteriales bacterium]|nr:MAG: hypothetical protein EOP55_07865 [Sphingobacteriales bacterium]
MKKCQIIALKLILYFQLIFVVASAQENVVSKLLSYKKILDNNPIEKIHIHTNQPFYMAYDTLWFKAYVINANLNRPSDLSKSLTLDLIDPEGKIVRHIKAKLNVGLADGYLNLSDSLKSGNYTLRAYTNLMRNYGSNFYYQRSLMIKNKPVDAQKLSKETISLTFFPEGGDLVTGLKSTVAFKAIEINGLAINVSGKIADDKGKTVSSITSEHLGMGRFEFTPETGRKYFAEISENGKPQRFQLPDSKPNGYIMQVNSLPDSLQLKITCSPELSNKSLLTLIGAQDGITRYISRVNPSEKGFITSLAKTSFYTGIVQFTIFGADGLPVAERLNFCNNNDLLKIEAEVKAVYTKKEQAKLLVDLKNIDDKRDIGSLSVSVYNESLYPFDEDEENSIYSDLLLTTDLKGYIEKPNYYFGKTDYKIRQRNLDNLMLTQGWRRFSWRNKLSKNLPVVSSNETIDNEIKGKVLLTSGKPYIDGEVTLFQSGINRNILQTKTDTAGNFIFKELNIIDTANFVISTNTAKEKKNLKIQIFGLEQNLEKIAKPNQTQQLIELADSSSSENKKLDDLYFKSKGINLHQVNISAKKPGPIKESANLNGPGRADAIVLAKDLETTHDLSTYLVNNVNGLKTYNGKIYSRTTPDSDSRASSMLVILDGVQLEQETFSISDINANDVGSIEVLKGTSAAIYGMNGFGGVLIITSKKGKDHSSDALTKSAKGILPFSTIGYQMQKEFYSPVYNVTTINDKDFRKAVYWKPKVITSTDKKTEVSFFNSDYIGKYKIVIEGINADGQIGRAVYNYEVK